MSAAANCGTTCCDAVTVTEIPGSPGTDGDKGDAGTNGINAFTVTTLDFSLPGAPGPIAGFISVGVSSWMSIGQVLIVNNADDNTEWAHIRVVTIPSATTFTGTWLNYDGDASIGTVFGDGSTVSPSGVQPTGPTAVVNGGTGSTTATAARAALGVGGASLAVYASGTAYQLTAVSALVNFGTTDPSLTITSAGVWLILARARVDYNGSTFAAVQTGTLKLRRTNNTAADLTNSPGSFLTDIITTLSYTLDVLDLAPVIYTTTNSNDIIQLWGDVTVIPSAGSLDVSEASIVAIKLFDQTV